MRCWLVAAIVTAFSASAFAQEPTEADRLFQEGRDLLAAGKPDEACAKFELSIKKDPRAVGTLLNLALCNERLGKLATIVSPAESKAR